jgi:hypothetical protein
MPEWTPPTPQVPKWRCRVHEVIETTYQITIRNKEGEVVVQNNYCLQCYELFIRQHLDPLPRVAEDPEVKSL